MRPAIGLHQAHDRIEAGRLAGAVRPEEADNFAAMHVERDVVKYGAAVIGLGDRADFEAADRRGRLDGSAWQGRRLRSLAQPPLLRDREVSGHPAAALADAGRPAIDHRAAGIEIDRSAAGH